MTDILREAAGADWLPVGEEPQPLGSITHCTVLRHAGISVLSSHSGRIDSERDPSTGMYVRDTRHLSKLRFSFGGVEPIVLDAGTGTTLSAIFTNPAIRSARTAAPVPAQSLVVRRTRAVAESLLETMTVSNYGFGDVTVALRVEYAADFADIFEVRGYQRTLPRNPVECHVDERRVHWEYLGADDNRRTTTLAFSEPPAVITAREATFEFHLAPRETREVSLEVAVDGPETGRAVNDGIAHILSDERKWLGDVTHIETDHDGINATLRRSLLDIHALRTVWGDDSYLAAGVPWFDSLFGRDSLIAGMELLPFAPAILREALIVLSRYQADTTDPKHDATPGKIPHELRWGELASSGEVPFGRYYGSVDATPLFVLAASQYMHWTGDKVTLRAIWPAVKRAIGWCRDTIGRSSTNFLCYMRVSAGGLENQGWKDSHDAIVWPDGTIVRSPTALIEVQGYYAAALDAFARLRWLMGEGESGALQDEVTAFCGSIDAAFADPALGYALCLDAEGNAVPTAASNAGHMLWAHAARKDLAYKVAQRLMQDDLYSGWGVRTLSTSTTGYNPLGYHVGSVWPHDNALILAGMRWYGFEDAAKRLGTSLIDMALGFREYRVPELFSGDARGLRAVPTPYPVASRPQAWAAASLPSVFASLLGIHPGRPGQLHILRPVLPDEVGWLQVRNLRFGQGAVDLSFRRTGTHVSVEVERLHGGLEVVLSQSSPNEALPGPRNPGR